MGKGILSPEEIAKTTIQISEKKANLSFFQMILLGIFAGIFIGLGAHADITIIQTLEKFDIGFAKFMGAAVFPVGLMLVVLAGAELFTGNNLMILGLMDKKITIKQILKNWSLVYIGNFIGSVLLALAIYKTGLYNSESMIVKANEIANSKVSLSFDESFMRAILCNMIVALTIWVSTAAKYVIGKVFAIWFPIMLFVLSGFEHSVANMYFIPIGKFTGLDISWTQIWVKNLIPVTIGNIIGGGIIVSGVYYLVYILPNKNKEKNINEGTY